jgi:hypothetical protein
LGLLAFVFSSCQEVIEYELDTAESRLAVEGLITNLPGPYQVRLSHTKGYLAEGRTPGVNGALVIVSDNQGTTDTLKQTGEGLYQTSLLQGRPGNTYYLRAVVNGKTYTARSYMPAVAPVDSLTFRYRKSGHDEAKDFEPYLHFREPAGKGNYYRWNVAVNGQVDPDALAVLSDDISDGVYAHAGMGFGLKKGDQLQVELYALDKPAHAFWVALVNQQHAGGGPFERTPANAPGNISNGAIGFFGASAVSVIAGEVK